MSLLRLRSTQAFLLVTLVAAGLITAGLVIAQAPIGAALLCCAGAVLLISGLGLVLMRFDAVRRRQLRVIQRATARSEDAARSIGRMAPIVRQTQGELQQLREEHNRSHAETLEVIRAARTPELAFDPQRITETAGSRGLSRQAGRQGAALTDDPNSDAKLRRLLDAQPDVRTPVLGLITSDDLRDTLSAVGLSSAVLPGLREARVPLGLSYFVVEERALWSGAWAGSTVPSGLALFEQIASAASAARARAVVTVLITGEEPIGALSGPLAQHFEFVMRGGEAALREPETVVLGRIAAYVAGRGNP